MSSQMTDVGDVVFKTFFGPSWTLKDVRYIPGLKRRLISVGQHDEEGYHVGFGEQQWKVTKGCLVVARGNRRGSLYMVKVHPEGIGAISDGSGSAALETCESSSSSPSESERIDSAQTEAVLNELALVETYLKLEAKEDIKYKSGLLVLYRRQGNCKGWSKFIQKDMALHLLHQYEDPAIMILLSKAAIRVASTGLREEAPKMLWADSVSTAYLIYRIPYILIGLHIPEEEWRGKDTSLAHLKVFDCDSFVKVKDVCGESMKCTFIGNGSDEMRYNFRDTKSHQVIRSRDITFVDSIYRARSVTDSSSLMKPIQKSQVVLVNIPKNLSKNDSIVTKHGLSSEITQSPGGSSDTSEGSENSGSFEDSAPLMYSLPGNYLLLTENGKLESYSEALSSKESIQWKKAINEEMVSLEKNQTCSLVRLLARKKASQSLWMFKVKE
ncbi:retrovirus-related pol polyprotein from transposon TNT 1-94 [Tanacetum coccineum]